MSWSRIRLNILIGVVSFFGACKDDLRVGGFVVVRVDVDGFFEGITNVGFAVVSLDVKGTFVGCLEVGLEDVGLDVEGIFVGLLEGGLVKMGLDVVGSDLVQS